MNNNNTGNGRGRTAGSYANVTVTMDELIAAGYTGGDEIPVPKLFAKAIGLNGGKPFQVGTAGYKRFAKAKVSVTPAATPATNESAEKPLQGEISTSVDSSAATPATDAVAV